MSKLNVKYIGGGIVIILFVLWGLLSLIPKTPSAAERIAELSPIVEEMLTKTNAAPGDMAVYLTFTDPILTKQLKQNAKLFEMSAKDNGMVDNFIGIRTVHKQTLTPDVTVDLTAETIQSGKDYSYRMIWVQNPKTEEWKLRSIRLNF